MGEHGGWPLTMFLTPDGEPFWGGTYFPPEPRWGRPELSAGADVDRAPPIATSARMSRRTSRRCARGCSKLAQPESGGAQGDRRHPGRIVRPHRRAAAARGRSAQRRHRHGAEIPAIRHLRAAVAGLEAHAASRPTATPSTRTLTTISQGGIYDHLGGGWARYSVDARWLVPHFEKMLYDNAELIGLLTLVWQETRDPLYATAGRRDDRLARARDDPSARAGSTAASTPTASTRKANSTSGPRPRSMRCSASAPRCSSASTT